MLGNRANGNMAMTNRLHEDIHAIQIETTSRCSLNCISCLKSSYRDDWQERDMSEGLFQNFVEQIGDSTPSVHLQGWGEPLLHPLTISHVRQLKSAGLSVSFTSNGTRMDTTLAHALIDAGLDGLTFSMAGASLATQEKLRGVGSLALLRSSIKTFIAAKNERNEDLPHVAVSYLLTPESVKELPEAVSWCVRNGVDAFVTVHLTQAGGMRQRNLQFHLTKTEAEKYRLLRLKTHARSLFRNMHLDLRPFHPTLTALCDKNPLNALFINAVGDVSPCVFLCPPVQKNIQWHYKGLTHQQSPLRFGNIEESSLAKIWDSDPYRDFRGAFRKRVAFHDRLLCRVRYSAAGTIELEKAVTAINSYFSDNPPPKACSGCAKLDGY